jgi:protein associated with RNAse G/E
MQPGDLITVRALRADGRWYRRWLTTVESIYDACIITFTPAAGEVENASGKVHRLEMAIRSHYWRDKPYNLLEVLNTDGSLNEIYLNVASPPRVRGDSMSFVDHELDVSKFPGQPARIVDQDEFEAAIAQYGYTAAFQEQCWRAAEEARLLADTWEARPMGRG